MNNLIKEFFKDINFNSTGEGIEMEYVIDLKILFESFKELSVNQRKELLILLYVISSVFDETVKYLDFSFSEESKTSFLN